MSAWCSVLEVGLLGGNEVFNFVARFVVHPVEAGLEAPAFTPFVHSLIRSEEFRGVP